MAAQYTVDESLPNTATLASIVPANILTTSGYNPWLGIS
jgi:hypothetical protein